MARQPEPPVRRRLALHSALRHRRAPYRRRPPRSPTRRRTLGDKRRGRHEGAHRAAQGPGASRSGSATRGSTRTPRARREDAPEPGDVVTLVDHDGRFIGRGFYNPRSQIPAAAVHARRTSRSTPPSSARPRRARARPARRAWGCRRTRPHVYRLVNSEGDELPGLIVDVYGDAASCSSRRWAWPSGAPSCSTRSRRELGPAHDLRDRARRYAAGGLRRPRRGSRAASLARAVAVPSRTASTWRSSRSSGQKTGMFLDQRETAPRVGAAGARGARARLYTYAGGFALRPRAAAPPRSTAVDTSARALARVEAHAAPTALAVERWRPTPSATSRRPRPRAFDLVIVDPPKFARARKDLEAARKGYERLNALALNACARARCSHLLVLAARRRRTFERILAAGAKHAGRRGPHLRARAAPAPTTRCRPASPRAST